MFIYLSAAPHTNIYVYVYIYIYTPILQYFTTHVRFSIRHTNDEAAMKSLKEQHSLTIQEVFYIFMEHEVVERGELEESSSNIIDMSAYGLLATGQYIDGMTE